MNSQRSKLSIFTFCTLIANAVYAHPDNFRQCIDSLRSNSIDHSGQVAKLDQNLISFGDAFATLQSFLVEWQNFSNDKSIGISQKIEQDRIYRPVLSQKIEQVLASVSSAENYQQFLGWLKSDLFSFKTVRVRDLIKTIDFASPLVRIRKDLSSETKSQLFNRMTALTQDRWQAILPVFQISLEPDAIFAFLDSISNSNFINSSESGILCPSFYTAMKSLPTETRKQVASLIAHRYSQISKGDESTTQLGRFTIRGPKVIKRNLEIVYRFLFQDQLESLVQKMQSPSSRSSFLNSVNQYLSVTTAGLTSGGRGNYDFKLVLQVADQLQATLKDHLDQSEHYIQMYGSFPNGKANLLSSDVDIHLSDRMSEDFLSPYIHFKNVFMETITDGEPIIAELLGQLDFEKGKLVTYIVESPSVSAERRHGVINNFAEYNPIVIKVQKTDITIQIFDATTQHMFEFKIPNE